MKEYRIYMIYKSGYRVLIELTTNENTAKANLEKYRRMNPKYKFELINK